MNLFSIEFIILLMVLLLVYYIVPGKLQWQCLLIASLIFYAASGVKNLLFIGVTSVSIWLAGMAMERIKEDFKKAKRGTDLSKEDKKLLKERMVRKKRIILGERLS